MAGMPEGLSLRAAEQGFPNVLRVPAGDGAFGLLDVSGPITIAAKTVELPMLAGKPAPTLVYVARGAIYPYQFKVINRAGTYWYHPHPHKIAGKQAHLGLASLFIVEDEEERALQKALDVALGVTDIPLVIQDKRFDRNGALTYAPTQDESANGFLGDRIVVNLTSRPHFNAATRLYRFRILVCRTCGRRRSQRRSRGCSRSISRTSAGASTGSPST